MYLFLRVRVFLCIYFRCFVLASGISGCLCGSACTSVRIFISVYEPFVLSSSVVCVSVGGGRGDSMEFMCVVACSVSVYGRPCAHFFLFSGRLFLKFYLSLCMFV